jgi:hypothetical protein
MLSNLQTDSESFATTTADIATSSLCQRNAAIAIVLLRHNTTGRKDVAIAKENVCGHLREKPKGCLAITGVAAAIMACRMTAV